MKIKKTIAAIAALTMALSSLPVMAFADDGVLDGAAITTPEDTENLGGQDVNYPVTYAAVSAPTVSGLQSGSGTATMGETNGTTHVSVQLSAGVVGATEPDVPNEGTPSNEPGRSVYCIRIPVEGLDSTWELGGHYAYDNGAKANNIKDGELLLWLETRNVTYTMTLTKGSEVKTIYITSEVGATAPAEPTVSGITGGTPSVTIEGNNVNVQLTPAEGETISGQPENGAADARENYYIVIPVAGIDASWTFGAGSQYGYDKSSHHEWNIAKDALKLWLPITDGGECTVVLAKGSETKTIVIKTKNGVPVVTTPTNAEKLAAAKSELATALSAAESGWDFKGKTLDEIKSVVDSWFESQSFNFAGNVTIVYNDVDEGGGRWIGFAIVFGDAADYSFGIWKDVTAATVTPAPTPTPAPVPVPVITGDSGVPAVVVSYTPAATTVTSTSQIASSSKSNISINAKETKLTTKMVNAFVKNSKAKTLTLNYGTKVKIAIAKKDVKAAAAVAKMDFSATTKTPSDAVKKEAAALTKGKIAKVTQMNFKSTAKFDGVSKVTVQNRVGGQYAGQKAVVYEIVDGKLVKVATAKVGGSGLVSFKISHFGQYVIAVEK